MYTLVIIWLGKLLIVLTRWRGGGGSAFPGLVIERLHPKFLSKMQPRLKAGTCLVTGTNGKTTTTKILAGILNDSHYQVVTNRAGSNMSRGIAGTLAEQASLGGRFREGFGLFEVDEAFVPDVAKKLQPKSILVLNLLRDQLDRYGELDRTADLIARGLEHCELAVLNADDPRVAGLSKKLEPHKVVFYGATAGLRAQVPHDDQLLSKLKRHLDALLHHRPEPHIMLVDAKPAGEVQRLTVQYQKQRYQADLPLPGTYNAYNAVAALSVASLVKGLDFMTAVGLLSKVQPAFGRSEKITVNGKDIQLLLVKNPAGFNQVIQTFLCSDKKQPLLIAINDNIADGRDVSWLWDVDFEALHHFEHKILATGTRGYDLALRLKYAEIKSTVELEMATALKQFLSALGPKDTGYIVPTYTAMLSLRKLLAKKAQLSEVWE
jgi:lipid II isoglutaminyl synthase (glutamine-hydrolysing)